MPNRISETFAVVTIFVMTSGRGSSTYLVTIGTLTYSLSEQYGYEIPERVARRVAESLAADKERALRGRFEEEYRPRVMLVNLRHGSWLADLSINFDFWLTAAAIYKFLDKYESIRGSVLALARDISYIDESSWRWFRRTRYRIRSEPKERTVLEREQLKISDEILEKAEHTSTHGQEGPRGKNSLVRGARSLKDRRS